MIKILQIIRIKNFACNFTNRKIQNVNGLKNKFQIIAIHQKLAKLPYLVNKTKM